MHFAVKVRGLSAVVPCASQGCFIEMCMASTASSKRGTEAGALGIGSLFYTPTHCLCDLRQDSKPVPLDGEMQVCYVLLKYSHCPL